MYGDYGVPHALTITISQRKICLKPGTFKYKNKLSNDERELNTYILTCDLDNILKTGATSVILLAVVTNFTISAPQA